MNNPGSLFLTAMLFASLVGLSAANDAPSTPPGVTTDLQWPSEPPADCPIPKSDTLTGLVFTDHHAEYADADAWYPSWASDGNLYSSRTDGVVNVSIRLR